MGMTEPLDPHDFLTLARELAGQNDEQGRLRTAVGRAYYALFLIAREKTHIMAKRETHEKVIQALKKTPGYRPTADQLDKLRRLREVADYELAPKDPTDSNWKRNWSKVENFVAAILPKLESL
jgi:uncharacterized protein (UPF0332 family)